MSGIFNPAAFNNAAFNIGGGVTPPVVEVVVKTGTGGIDPEKKRRTIVKPTGLIERKKEGRLGVEARVDESRQIQAEVAAKLAREFTEETLSIAAQTKRIEEMSMAEVDAEIGVLLRKQLQTEEEELMMLLMIASIE